MVKSGSNMQDECHSLKSATNETLSIKYGVRRVHGSLILGGITNETLLSRERDVGRCCPVTLCVQMGSDLFETLKDMNAHGRWQ